MIVWIASYPKSGNTWIRFFIISLLMGDKTRLNLNHLKAILAYPNVSQFENLISNFLDLNEVAKNWIPSQKKINSDNNLRFLKTHNMLGKLLLLLKIIGHYLHMKRLRNFCLMTIRY